MNEFRKHKKELYLKLMNEGKSFFPSNVEKIVYDKPERAKTIKISLPEGVRSDEDKIIVDKIIKDNKNKRANKAKKRKRQYYKEVRQITKMVNKVQIEGYNKSLIYNRVRDGIMVTAYNSLVIDHKIPLSYGYKNNIPPEKIANISNLQYLTVKENMIKGVKPLIDHINRWIVYKVN